MLTHAPGFLVGRLLLFQHVTGQGVTAESQLQLGFTSSGKPFLASPSFRALGWCLMLR